VVTEGITSNMYPQPAGFHIFYLIPPTRILVNNKTKQAEEEEMIKKKKERFQPIEMVIWIK
jgi:hypothetical protein